MLSALRAIKILDQLVGREVSIHKPTDEEIAEAVRMAQHALAIEGESVIASRDYVEECKARYLEVRVTKGRPFGWSKEEDDGDE